tara:strand:- start:69 stop:626 length:558 start_codon:yes stop_codon:yes gene_type:complete
MQKKKKLELSQELDSFVKNIREKYNRDIKIIISDSNFKLANTKKEILSATETLHKLNVLENIVISTMHNFDISLCDVESLVINNRKRELIMWTQTFSYIARTMGFTCTGIAKHLDRNHATVISSCKVVKGYLEVGDIQYTRVFIQIMKSIKNYVGIISTDTESKDDTKSILNALWDQEKSVITFG